MLESLANLATGSTTLWFAAAAILLFLIAIAVGTATVIRSEIAEGDYRRKVALMPAFESLRAAEAALGEKRRERDQLLEQLKALHQEQAEAQRHRLDAQHWQSLAEQAKRDYDNKQDLIDEVEGLRTEYEDAANDVAARNEELTELTRKRSELSGAIEAAQRGLEELEDRRRQVDDLTSQLDELGRRRDELQRELGNIKDRRDERLRAAFEVDQLARRLEELEHALQALPDQVRTLEERRDTLKEEIEDLRREADRLRHTRDEIDRLRDQKIGLGTEIEALERDKERLEASVALVSRVDHGTGEEDSDESQKMADLLQKPTCLFSDDGALLLPETVVEDDETAMLSSVADYLEELNLEFEERVFYRFHTSLKTSFISPLTVLAGISGTGKSQLPQRYAEAMGMHFLKVAVQPRWDSPQDLLGFYNYLEKSYKATELARALVRMDYYFHLPQEQENAADRMLLVLLDEMNLARVEYYFSEFLSRLEGRPEPNISDPNLLLPGRIDIDVPSRNGEPVSVYPGHNVLFTGTMNEDESTQALSDKVLDRANTLRFRKPEELRSQTLEERVGGRTAHLPFETWRRWHRRANDLAPANKEFTQSVVTELNDILTGIGRPFGRLKNSLK